MLQLIRVTKRQMVQVPGFNYNLRKPAPKPSEYDKERAQYKKLMHQYRQRLIKQFWEEQEQVENKYIQNYLDLEKQKNDRLEVYRRSQTVIQTYAATQQHNRQLEQEKIKNDRIKKYLIDQDIRKMNKQQIVRVLSEEAKNWICDSNLYEKVVSSLIMPNTIIDQVTYYHDLQEKAIFYETASYDKIDELNNPNAEFQWKNRLGMPIYQRVVSLIKFLKQDNPIGKLNFEWDTCRSIILQDSTLSETEMKEQLEKINGAFESLITYTIQELEADPVKKLQEINKQVLRLYNLLELWEKYITIVKMDSSTAQQMVQAANSSISLFDSTGHEDYLIASSKDKELNPNIKGKEVGEEIIDQKYISADETHTDSEDIDLEKLSQTKTQQKSDSSIKKDYQFDPETIKEDTQKYSQVIEQLFSEAEQKAQEAEKKFDIAYRKNPQRKIFYNDQLTNENLLDAKSIFEGVDLEQLFPLEILQNSNRQPYLEFKNASDIENHYLNLKALWSLRKSDENNVVVNPDILKFNTSVAAETYKQILIGLNIPNQYEQLKLDTLKLIDAVGEIKVHDADFLLKVWNYYN